MLLRFLILLSISFTLTGCISREQADIKLAKGCESGVNALLDKEGKALAVIQSKNYSDEDSEGSLHRRITLAGQEKDGWLELDKNYSCLFAEEWGTFKSYHRASLIQITVNDITYGSQNGIILGDFDDFARLLRVVENSMGQ